MQEQEEYSVLSKAAYDWYYGSHELAKQELEAYGLDDYEFDMDHSDYNSVVITKPDGSAVISYRGTDFTNPSDLLADFHIGIGVHSNPLMQHLHAMNRFEDASQKYDRVKFKYDSVKLTGHSLGGAQALHVARKNDGDAIVFNPGSSPFAEPFHSILTNDKPQTIYTTGDDFISYSSYLFDIKDKVIVVPRKNNGYFSHSLVHFLPPRQRITEPPKYLDPVNIETRERVRFCEVFPELCNYESSTG